MQATLKKPSKKETERAEAIESLRKWIPKGSTVYTILEHVSASGMSRRIRLVVLLKDDKGEPYPIHPNHSAALVLGRRRAPKGDGIVCQGCGMDMGFDLVYQLAHALYGDGYAINHRWL